MQDILLFLELNGQFDKLTDRTEGTLVPELADGALPPALSLPSSFLLPLSPSTALGGVFFLTLIMQKQATYGSAVHGL